VNSMAIRATRLVANQIVASPHRGFWLLEEDTHGRYSIASSRDRPSGASLGDPAEGDKDGKGFNIKLSCLPLNGRLVVREPKAEESAGR
jgi:hypothetical protein